MMPGERFLRARRPEAEGEKQLSKQSRGHGPEQFPGSSFLTIPKPSETFQTF
jgi:hypothetical protein